jgi:hypothetical protein
MGNMVKGLSLEGYPLFKHMVKAGNPVSCYDYPFVKKDIVIPYLAFVIRAVPFHGRNIS